VSRQAPLVLQRLLEIHSCLERAALDHAVGGALALAQYVLPPRGTVDIDINVTSDPALPARLLSELPDAIEIHPGAEDEIRGTGQVRLWWRDDELDTPIDLFLPQHLIYHQLVVERATPVDMLGVDMKVLAATDLMVFKLLYNRTKDWADIEGLLESGVGDPEEAAQWVTEFVGGDDPRLERLRGLTDTVQRPLHPLVRHQPAAEPSICAGWISELNKHCVLAARHPGSHAARDR